MSTQYSRAEQTARNVVNAHVRLNVIDRKTANRILPSVISGLKNYLVTDRQIGTDPQKITARLTDRLAAAGSSATAQVAAKAHLAAWELDREEYTAHLQNNRPQINMTIEAKALAAAAWDRQTETDERNYLAFGRAPLLQHRGEDGRLQTERYAGELDDLRDLLAQLRCVAMRGQGDINHLVRLMDAHSDRDQSLHSLRREADGHDTSSWGGACGCPWCEPVEDDSTA